MSWFAPSTRPSTACFSCSDSAAFSCRRRCASATRSSSRFHEPGTAFALGVNKTLWDELDPDDQNVIATAAAAENVRLLAEFNANNTAALDTLVREHGVQVRKLDDAILQALGKTSGEVLAETSGHDPLTRRVYESFLEFRKIAIRWGELSERAYLNARSLRFPYSDLD